jgi:3-methylcrotonyl-CoA carboxylase alpha subunit
VRLYAEIPEAGFLPSSGTLRRFDMPAPGADLRIESGIESGDSVGIDYDPMLAKLVVHAQTRAESVARLQRALSQVRIAGVGNNVMFLRRLAARAEFARGEIDIGFIERTPALINGTPRPATERVLAAAALWTLLHESATPAAGSAPPSAWSANDGWRLNAHLTRTLLFESGASSGELASVAVQYHPEGYLVRTGAAAEAVKASLMPEAQDEFHLRYAAQGCRVQIESDGGQLRLVLEGDEYRVRHRDARAPEVEGHQADASLSAPMPGRIIAHLVAPGSKVAQGAPLLIMEAMKMEHTICAPANGVLRAFRAAVGEQVKEGFELIDFEAKSA